MLFYSCLLPDSLHLPTLPVPCCFTIMGTWKRSHGSAGTVLDFLTDLESGGQGIAG